VDWRDDARRGLNVVSGRAESLTRFMESYARLAKLPPPNLVPVDLGQLARRIAGLETRVPIAIEPGTYVPLRADPDQLEQLLINLIRNAADASMETCGKVSIGWRRIGVQINLWVCDEGPGLANSGNLFVPFFTTKPGGSGIGLVLCRQIAEAHGGELTLENRADRTGCIALLTLPL
jgi:two-component system, NtrC family, nitrogen regulation sensor histidine kinase NtrY